MGAKLNERSFFAAVVELGTVGNDGFTSLGMVDGSWQPLEACCTGLSWSFENAICMVGVALVAVHLARRLGCWGDLASAVSSFRWPLGGGWVAKLCCGV